MNLPLYPLRFRPVYKDYVWGGSKIIRRYNRHAPDGIYAESWEISDRDDGMSVVANGSLAGMSLREVCDRGGEAVFGRGRKLARFPLLVKLIDARETLSVQVHPNDEAALRHGGEPKTEMWYVLEADAGACVYSGLIEGVDERTFREAISNGTVEALLNRVPVKDGDTIFMPGGRVHAIGAGCLLLEIQQNSNTTYRIHDWGRTGADGKPRDLHVEQAIRVMEWGNADKDLATCPYFRFESSLVEKNADIHFDGTTFRIGFVEEGTVRILGETFEKGATFLIPAALVMVSIEPLARSRIAWAWQP